MNKIILILGGARSGKSSYAIELAKKCGKNVAFIATCQPLDEEMKERIKSHKSKRPVYWKTFEEPQNISMQLKKIGAKFDAIIIDCLTLFVSNLLLTKHSDAIIEDEVKKILEIIRTIKCKTIIIVSNEVGLGIVPKNKLARRFRDIAGRINQMVAQAANTVFFMLSGLPLKIKERRK